MLDLAAFLLALGSLIVASIALAVSFYAGTRERIALGLLLFLSFLYAIPVISGTLSILNVHVYLISSLAIVLSAFLFRRKVAPQKYLDRPSGRLGLSILEWIMASGVGLLILARFSRVLWGWIAIHPLGWDTITFALPNAISYWQLGTLWHMDLGFGQTYSYGYELVLTTSIAFLQSEAQIGLLHALFAIACLLYFAFSFSRLAGDSSVKNALTLLSIVGLSVVPGFNILWAGIGKNDVALMAFGLAALYFLLLYIEDRSNRHLIGQGLALGLMVSTKATGILYVALFLALLVFYNRHSISTIVRSSAVVLLPCLVFGLPWYLRNWIMTGNLFEPALGAVGWERAIISNLWWPDRLNPYGPLMAILIAGIIVPVYLIAAGSMHSNPSFLTVNVIAIASVLIFIVTPFGAYGSIPGEFVQVRLSVIMVPTLMMAVAAELMHRLPANLLRKGPEFAPHWIIPPFWKPKYIAATLLAGFVAVVCAQSATYRRPMEVLPEDPSQAYLWIDHETKNGSLLNFGLRSYGLLGADYSNRVHYTTHSYDITLKDVLAALQMYPSDYILISRDPNPDSPKDFPPAVDELAAFGAYPLVYRDAQVMIYSVPSLRGQGMYRAGE